MLGFMSFLLNNKVCEGICELIQSQNLISDSSLRGWFAKTSSVRIDVMLLQCRWNASSNSHKTDTLLYALVLIEILNFIRMIDLSWARFLNQSMITIRTESSMNICMSWKTLRKLTSSTLDLCVGFFNRRRKCKRNTF